MTEDERRRYRMLRGAYAYMGSSPSGNKIGSASGEVATFNTDLAAPLISLNLVIEPHQEGTGDPSPENVRPITGRTGVTVTRAGKNLITSPAETTVTVSSVLKDRIVLAPGTYSISLSAKNTGSATGLIRLTTNNIIVAEIQIPIGGSSYTRYATSFTISEPASFKITAQGVTAGYNYTVKDFQIEIGTTATAYEPYTAQTYPISFGSAGTVYGGTLDVTTGVLTVDMVKITFDGGASQTWFKSSRFPGSFYVDAGLLSPRLKAQIDGGSFICSHAKYIGAPIAGPYVYGTCALDSAVNLFLGTADMTLVQFKSWLGEQYAAGTPVEICGELYTPLTYPLTPTEVRTLIGTNNIFMDADGTVTAEYQYRS